MQESFPFELGDVIGWIIRKKDGTVIKYNLISPAELSSASKPRSAPKGGGAWRGTSKNYHFSEWCSHKPSPVADLPIFQAKNIGLWIADAPGARSVYDQFDVAIDGGNALSVPGEYDLPLLYGNASSLITKLARHLITVAPSAQQQAMKTQVLKIRWADRCAPPVAPSFWPALLKQLEALAEERGATQEHPLKVLTICQGGHGRSGSALACLMMCLSSYTPLDALTHIRALHCARAIESKDQHVYLNSVAEFLGRDPDALDAEGVKSFKDRFLVVDTFDQAYKDRVTAGKGALVSEREATFC